MNDAKEGKLATEKTPHNSAHQPLPKCADRPGTTASSTPPSFAENTLDRLTSAF